MNTILLKRQSGVSLIEILVTTLILGIGLLGVASLQVASVSSNQEGFFHSQATSIAEDLSSRMRSTKISEMVPWSPMNHAALIANFTSALPYACAGVAPVVNCRADGGAAPDIACSDGIDDLVDMTNYDKWDICKIAEDTLPDGKVRVLDSGNMRLSVVVDWDATKARSDMGQKTNVNTFCSAAPINVAAERNCIVMELIP